MGSLTSKELEILMDLADDAMHYADSITYECDLETIYLKLEKMKIEATTPAGHKEEVK